MARLVLEIDELSPDAKELWNNIKDYRITLKGNSLFPVTIVSENIEEKLLTHIRIELKRMIKNSEGVIEQCDEIIRRMKTQHEYLSSDAKVARTLHTRLIDRLKNVLAYKSAFDFHIDVDDEKPNALFVDTFGKKPEDRNNIQATFEIEEDEADSNLYLSEDE